MTDGAAAWRGAVAACLIGTERAGPIALPEGLAEGVATDGPAGLLRSVAALGVWRMAGAAPDPAGSVPLDAVADTLPECSPAAAARLESLLAETRRHPAALRGEWCRLAAAAGLRVPDGLAPALLQASRGAPWADAAEAVLGARGPWLRRLTAPAAEDAPDLPTRLAALRLLRQNDPDAARTALAAGWEDDAADIRAALLAALETNLSMADEPFLEARLDDRAASVRTAAARRLEHLPGSRYAARMQARARAAVRLDAGALTIVLPEPDAAMRRDGLEVKGKAGVQDTTLLTRLTAVAPLASWDGAAAAVWVVAAVDKDWSSALLPGWAAAAARERSMPWLRALLNSPLPFLGSSGPPPPVCDTIGTLVSAIPQVEREALVTFALQNGFAMQSGKAPKAFLLNFCTDPWSVSFTSATAAWIVTQFGPGGPHGSHYRSHGLNLACIALHGAASAALPSLSAWAAVDDGTPDPALRRALDEAVETLRFRTGMQQELTA